jgi:pimeloyl-ACP methyl ester carboxylesterase
MPFTLRESHVSAAGAELRVLQAGPADGDPVLFLHGWPQDASAWIPVMEHAAEGHRCLAVDLPGIGGSSIPEARGDKAYLAGIIRELVQALQLTDLTLVGHDAGGMIVFSYLRAYPDLRAAVIMDTVVPGIPPWQRVLAHPAIWHFAFHAIPELPEILVAGHQRRYFDYFFDAISARPRAIPPSARDRYAASYRDPASLRQGFELYRALTADAGANAQSGGSSDTPTLYLRGSAEGGDLAVYRDGLVAAGLRSVRTALVDGAGHFAPEEAPAEVWAAISAHIAGAGG